MSIDDREVTFFDCINPDLLTIKQTPECHELYKKSISIAQTTTDLHEFGQSLSLLSRALTFPELKEFVDNYIRKTGLDRNTKDFFEAVYIESFPYGGTKEHIDHFYETFFSLPQNNIDYMSKGIVSFTRFLFYATDSKSDIKPWVQRLYSSLKADERGVVQPPSMTIDKLQLESMISGVNQVDLVEKYVLADGNPFVVYDVIVTTAKNCMYDDEIGLKLKSIFPQMVEILEYASNDPSYSEEDRNYFLEMSRSDVNEIYPNDFG